MILLYLAFVSLVFIPFPRFGNEGGSAGYLSKEAALPIKGLSLIFVFFRHFQQYVKLSDSILDRCFLYIDGISGQLIVVMFFFYSGYGIYESIKIKQSSYIRGFLKKRFLPVWFNFAICICFFLIFNLIAGRQKDLTTILLSFTGWTSIGNSNWFMFVTFVLYILIAACFIGFRRGGALPLILFSVATAGTALVLYWAKAESPWWYNTIFCFPAGMWYSFFKDRIDGILSQYYWGVFIALVLLNAVLFYGLRFHSDVFCAFSVAFSLLVVTITFKVRVRNPFLAELGKHVFSFYILQRLAFLMLSGLSSNIFLYFVSSFILALALSFSYDFLESGFRQFITARRWTR